MLTVSSRGRAVLLLGAALLGSVLLWAQPLRAQAAATPAWLDRMNGWRALSGLAPVTEDTGLSSWDYLHARYTVETQTLCHCEDHSSPWYTTQGEYAAQHSNLWAAINVDTPDTAAIDTWMQAPLHASGIMDPRLTATGYSAYRNPYKSYWQWKSGFALDVLTHNSEASGAFAQPVFFPGKGTIVPGDLQFWGESPDVLMEGCGYLGYTYPAGLPAFIEFGGGVVTKVDSLSFQANGAAQPACAIDTRNSQLALYLQGRGMVIAIPQHPLVAGTNYTVSMTVETTDPNTAITTTGTYAWSFGASNSLQMLPAAPAGVTAVAGDTTATVSWTAPTFQGAAPITSYTVTPYVDQTAGTPMTVTAPATTANFTGLVDGTTYWFTVTANNTVGPGPPVSSYSVTPTSSATPAARMTAASALQYQLPNSDGVTWQDMDANNLSLSFTPATSEVAIISANVDLWTANSGFNQDVGIWLKAGGAAGGVVAWKESGGSAGTFSPNAAMLQTAIPVAASTTYSVKLDWKTNQPALGANVFAGAGPIAMQFSPTRLTVTLIPSSGFATAASVQQYPLPNSDGATWQTIDATNLEATLTPSADGLAVITANADLWTANSGFNQDVAVFVNVNNSPTDQLVGWKESGGSAGTFSPNAAFLQAAWPVTSGSTYVFRLEWKTNKPAAGATIFAGAGPIGGFFSPTRLTVFEEPTAAMSSAATALQYHLTGSDGVTWTNMDPTGLLLNFTPSATGSYLVSANADLWTANSGFNQDLGIMVQGGSYTTPTLLAWKESGGSAGTFSPNAAYLETEVSLQGSTAYQFWIVWKTNRQATGASIFAAAGPLPGGGGFSPTRLTVIPTN